MYNAYKSILDRRIDEHKQLARNAWSHYPSHRNKTFYFISWNTNRTKPL